jgi:hypothetical protein
VLGLYLSQVPYEEMARKTGKSVSALQALVGRLKVRLADRIAQVSPTAKLHQERKNATVKEAASFLPSREEILGALRELPNEARTAIEFVHVKGGSVENLAKTLGKGGLEIATTRLEVGYESLSRKLDLPFPESFDLLAR